MSGFPQKKGHKVAPKKIHLKRSFSLQPKNKAIGLNEAILEYTGTATAIIEESSYISYVNSSFEKLSGYSRDEIVGKKKWYEFAGEQDFKKMNAYHHLRRKDPQSAPRNYEMNFIDRFQKNHQVYMTVGMIPGTKQSIVSILDITEQKKAEADLKSSKQLFDDLVDSNPDPIYVINKEGQVIYWNHAMEAISGLKASEVLYTNLHWSIFYRQPTKMIVDYLIEGKTYEDILKMERYKRFRMSRTRQGAITGVKLFPDFNGGRRWLKFYIKAMYDAEGRVVGAIETISDVTPEKDTSESLENRIRELEVLYKISHRQHMHTPLKRVMSGIIGNLVLACDFIGPARAKITLDNQVYTNLKKEERFYSRIESPIHVDERKRGKVELGYIDCVPNEESFTLIHEKKVIHVVADNIGKHVQNRELVNRYEKLVSKSMVGIFIVQNGVFKFVNPKFCRILGEKERQLLRKPCRLWLSQLEGCKGRVYRSQQIEIKKENEKKIYAEVFTQKINYLGKEAILGTIQDITRIKKAEQQQKHFNQELKKQIAQKTKDIQAANKRLQSLNSLKDEFIAIASHELRTPLTSARCSLSFLTDDQHEVSEAGAQIHLLNASQSLEDLNHLINNILDVSNIEREEISLNYEKVCLIQLIKKIIQQVSMMANEKQMKIMLEVGIDAPRAMAKIDQVRFGQVIRNVLENAIKYSPANTEIKISLCQNKSQWITEIKDEGVGIKKADLNIIFQKFKRVTNAYYHKKGSGLGLFIAHKIMELHNGKIEVESKLRKGTVFRMILPKINE